MPFTDYQPPPEPTIYKREGSKGFVKPCTDREHNPPSHIVLPEGTHTYVCPTCGKEQIVTVRPTYHQEIRD